MPGNDNLTYLGVLAAPTSQGARAVAVALTGGVELYHFVDAGLDTGAEAVREWLWNAGINPDEAAIALPNDILIRDILVPAIGNKALVVHHGDVDIPLVDELLSALAESGNAVIVSGVELVGPIAASLHGAAPRRAFALQARYEAALDAARKSPPVHMISGKVDVSGMLTEIAVDGPFLKRTWTLETQDDAFFVLTHVSHVGSLAAFVIEGGPAQAELKRLANEFGLNEKLAA
jgi:hypothetical protein